MSSDLPLQIAETIQTSSINRAPSSSHDLNPSTAASQKVPVTVHAPASDSSLDRFVYDDEGVLDGELSEDEEDIPDYVLKPTPRNANVGPLPDLRFEQSYLATIAGADSYWKVAYITIQEHVLLPLLQGVVWTLAVHGWRHWNRAAKLNGQGVGSKVRRWWFKTNNWKLPDMSMSGKNGWGNKKLADDLGDFYQNQNSGGD